MVNVNECYSDEVKLQALRDTVLHIKEIIDNELGIITVLFYQRAHSVEGLMVRPAYYLLREPATTTTVKSEYRTWFGLGSKRIREITTESEGRQVFGLAFGDRKAIRFEIFIPETRHKISEIAKAFAEKYGFDQLMIEFEYAE